MFESPSKMLLDCYAQYVGSLDAVDERNVYVGVALVAVGLAAAVFGWGLFLWNETTTYGTPGFFAARETAIAAAGLGIPALLLGFVTLLLGRDRVTGVTLAGTAACLVAVGLFVATYPGQWDVPSAFNSAVGVSWYALGLFVMTFSAGAAFSCRVMKTT